MSYIKSNLRPGEALIFFEQTAEPKKFIILYLILIALLSLIHVGLGVLVGIILIIASTLPKKSPNEFAVTTRRVIVKNETSTSEFLLEKIEGCDVIGTAIVIKGAGGTKHEIPDIVAYIEFKNSIYDAIEIVKHPEALERWVENHETFRENERLKEFQNTKK